MKKELLYIRLLAILGFFTLMSCQREDDILPAGQNASSANKLVNDWTSGHMDLYYLWNTRLPEQRNVDADPEDFFYGLLYTSDRFSYITDDARALKEDLSGTSLEVGYSPAFGKFDDTDQVFIIVEYVYPGSSAAQQGLKRGDIILEVNGETLNTGNYYDLYNQQAGYTLSLGKAEDGTITKTGVTISVTPAYISTDPIVHWEIKEKNGVKIGYLVYVEFLAGDNNQFLQSLDEVFSEMKTRNVTELIVDLRYNPGGQITAAKHLANAIAPLTATAGKEVFVKFEYNEILERYYREKEGEDSDNLAVKFAPSEYNLGIERVIFLTTSGSASASELIINGLEPYMEVVTIGEPTYGKFYGSYVIYDTSRTPRHNFAIMPVVMKYANALGVTDFGDGLAPDYHIADNMLEAKPFGDEADPMMAQALEVITGEPVINARTSYKEKIYTPLENKAKLRRGNVLKTVSLE